MSFIRVKALQRIAAEPTTLRRLATRLATDPPYTTVVVDDLQRRGLVHRQVHPADRRARIVTVTPDGAAAAALADRILAEPPEPLLRLDPDELAYLARLVGKLLEAGPPAGPDGSVPSPSCR